MDWIELMNVENSSLSLSNNFERTCNCQKTYFSKNKLRTGNKVIVFTVTLIFLLQLPQVSGSSFAWRYRRSPFRWKDYVNKNIGHRNSIDNENSNFSDDNRETESREHNFLSRLQRYYKTCFDGGEYLNGYSLQGGVNAGNYTNLGEVETLNECADLCCQRDTCMHAIILTSPESRDRNCFQVDCDDPSSQKCKPSSARKSKYHPSLFIRGTVAAKNKKEATSEGSRHSILNDSTTLDKNLPSLQRYKRGKPFCKKFPDNVCSEHVDSTKMYYFTSKNNTSLEKRLRHPISLLKSKLAGKCQTIALQAICYRFYPQCNHRHAPKPINVCDNECDRILNSDCTDDFQDAGVLKYLQRVIPNCITDQDGTEEDDEDKNEGQCIQLKNKLPVIESTDEDEGSSTTTVASTKRPSMVLVDVKNGTRDGLNLAENDNTDKPARKPTVLSTTNSTSTHSVHNKKPTQPTNNSQVGQTDTTKGDQQQETSEETSLKNNTATHQTTTTATATKTSKTTKADGGEIRVSAGDNAVLTLPTDKVNLYASTWPKEPNGEHYSYTWTQISAPLKSHGSIEGKNTKSVKLTNLQVPGLYTFKLEVKSTDGKHGVGFVNITVKKADRINRPPRAEITQPQQEITLPTNTIILDGSKSMDDDKIVSYKWEEIKSPIKEKTVFTETDKKILELKNLVVGVYKFKLTVTDSDGETDSTEATVTVKKEQDYPPKANAGNDMIIRLPNNSVVLNGNKSTDDKGIVKYGWRKSADSPTCDVVGSDKSILRVSKMVVGTYTFILKVTDSSAQENEAQVKIVVLPEQNTVPVAVAGDDRELVYPDSSTTLDGSKSTDNSRIVSYHWEKLSGPDSIKMVGADRAKVHLTDLVTGTYVFKLTVMDDKKLTGSDTIKIHVKKDHNDPPVAVAGDDKTIFLPVRTTTVDGSRSHDDEMVQSYKWVRTGLSPAAGKVVNGSESHALLQLTDLVKGTYTFDLSVTDNKGLTGTDSVIIKVKESPYRMSLVELYLDVDIKKFTEEDKKQLLRKISVLLEIPQEYVIVQEISDVGYKRGIKIVFYATDPNIEGRRFDGEFVARTMKQKVGNGGKLFDLTMQKVEPYVCRNNCSGHGFCDENLKQCVCDAFWMANVFKANFGEKKSNCDWSVLYTSIICFIIFMIIVGVCWTAFFCVARRKRSLRRKRYRQLRSTDPDGAEDEILLIPKGLKNKFTMNSLTFTEESDDDSEEETTVFDKKQRQRNGIHRMNGHANGKVPKYHEEAF